MFSKKNLIIDLIAYLLILVSSLILIVSGTKTYLINSGPLKTHSVLLFKKGTSTSNLVKQLVENQIIKYPDLFYLCIKFIQLFNSIKAGEYYLTADITPLQIIELLINGKSVLHRLTIPEGLTVNEIIIKLNQEHRLVGDINQKVAEGSLLPDTYFFSYGEKKQDLINKMQYKMQVTLDQLWQNRNHNLPFKTKYEALILASIVEKETNLAIEQPKVAAVFINRLKKNIKLQSDPTTIYAITQGQGKLNRELTRADLKNSSLFNTYHHHGLPPQPITNPGKAAIEATFNPEQIEDLFFVVSKDGGHNFAKTLIEHNKNVKAYYEYRNVIKANK